MNKKFFTAEEIEILSKNPYVKAVSTKGITYSNEFKQIFIDQYEKGRFPREIFRAVGLI